MFTGIIEEIGAIRNVARQGRGVRLTVAAHAVLGDLTPGDSVALSGACVTAVKIGSDSFTCDLSQETLERTKLGQMRVGARINLERAVLPGTRMGGHIVLGHVDGLGAIRALERSTDGAELVVAFPKELTPFIVDKGSIAVDGISLTPFGVRDGLFRVALIPTTLAGSTLGLMRAGDAVNLETDITAKYAVQAGAEPGPKAGGITWDLLRDAGFMD